MLRLVSYALALGAAAALAAPRAATAAELALESCRLAAELLPAAFARCGILAVPEDPSTPGGRTVDLFVARVPSLSSTPRADPLVLIAGGPGESTVDMYLQLRAAFEPARRERDVILVDQRGTGRSAAGFDCGVPDELSLDTAGDERLAKYIDQCLRDLEHDPRFYTTSVAVQDLDRVRAALGIAQWNVYGVSYGTRVAQQYLRRFPEHARSVVLDGVVPPELALGPDIAREAQRALDRIFARCAADDACHARFPNLPAEFRELLARLDKEPVTTASPYATDAGGGAADDGGKFARAAAARPRAFAELQLDDCCAAAGAAARGARRRLRAAREPDVDHAAPLARIAELPDEQRGHLHGGRAVRRGRFARGPRQDVSRHDDRRLAR